MKQPQVIVVGAGPVGLVTALGLARRGIAVTVLERELGIVRSPRAMVYHNGVLPGLADLGILGDVEKAGFRVTDLAFWDHANRDAIRFDLRVFEGHEPYAYNIHLGQDRLADVALEHLRRHSDAEVVFGALVTDVDQHADGVSVSAFVDGRLTTYRADYVVATEGASSSVRTAAGLGFEGTTWPERFIATNIRYDLRSLGYADSTLVVDPVMGGVIARVDESDLWRVTYHEDSALPMETMASRIAAFFAELLPPGAAYELVQFSPYTMHQRSASSYRLGRVLLAGDAAHVTNPIGGLGLTGGLFDSYVLSEALAAVLTGTVDDAILDEYSRLRRDAFLDYGSPRATMFKTLVFDTTDREELDTTLAALRSAAADPESARQALTVSQPYRTPSLLGG
ncbi:MAG TPA: NAD(P)/FAD-dependent oxidoreductase [Streptomyces sp.]|uniref:FAD-dependent oxidoreductase n=1 Tax=Streptomyces sp. TaxID=1931 RepID=UPI002BF5E4A8|nr:NAD(P)/FAD-dependent oxidoreductase [Streptomyces sp.]HWU11838.1 NAD(P)/FAD-dependent oxidoreductase [Streptomyces sp.]